MKLGKLFRLNLYEVEFPWRTTPITSKCYTFLLEVDMKLGHIIVEQVNKQSELVLDYDQSLTSDELFTLIKNYFPNIEETQKSKIYHGVVDDLKFSLRIKNITYLGHPHPKFKKRIQIASDLKEFVQESRLNGYVPLLIGIYTYKSNVVFCDFEISDYLEKSANNSSAHVSTNDIREATKFGFFEKTDLFNNHIKLFTACNSIVFLQNKLRNELAENPLVRMLKAADLFAASLGNSWLGIDAYDEMHHFDYAQRNQAEWIGFYLEYKFDVFLTKNSNLYQIFTRGLDRKSRNQIDLDIFFPELNMYGDLKAHNISSRDIIANDVRTIKNVLQRSMGESIYYFVASGRAVLDKNMGFVTTRYYNSLKGNPAYSYQNRMKHSFILEEYFILDLNITNYDHTKLFSQGKNSNGKPRNPKILFPGKNLNNFLIHRGNF